MVPARLTHVASSSGQSGRSVATARRQALPVVAPVGGGATPSLLLPPVMRWMAGLVAAFVITSVGRRPCGPSCRRWLGRGKPGRRQAVAAAGAAAGRPSRGRPTWTLGHSALIQLAWWRLLWLACERQGSACEGGGVTPSRQPGSPVGWLF